MRSLRRRPVTLIVALAMIASLAPLSVPSMAASNATVFFNEIHYDNAGTDEGEFLEVAGPAGTGLAGWSIVLYNGANGLAYNTRVLSGVIPDQDNGFGTLHFEYPSNGIQNGAPDGMALVDASNEVVQFLSYEGTFTAMAGPADGMLSEDIGVSQSGSGAVGNSLQLQGTGNVYGHFTWSSEIPWTPGSPNTDQVFDDSVPPPPPPPPPTETPVFFNEIHYDNVGTDLGEAIEVAGPAGTDLSGWSILLYNGANGAIYNTTTLSEVIPDEGLGFGVVVVEYPSNGIQNGAPDGMALVDASNEVVQFLSYEGTFTATGGPAVGMTSEDIGVKQDESTPVGTSLQLTGPGTFYEEFTWVSDVDQSFGFTNVGQVDLGFGPPVVRVCSEPPEISPISEVQGPGEVTPCAGELVIIQGVVVGDYQGTAAQGALRGFYVQSTDDDHDDDPLTSEGIFVFNFDNVDVALGDLVSVTGVANEFQGQTQLGFPDEIVVLDSGHTVTATEVKMPFDSADYLERHEGMLVTFPQALYVTEFFQLGRFGEIVVSSGDRLAQPTNVVVPGGPAAALQAENDLNRLKIDDNLNNQNPDPILFGRGGDPLTAANTLRGGDTVTDGTGVMTFGWAGNAASPNAYRLRVVGDLSDTGLVPGGVVPAFEAVNPRPAETPDVGGSMEVASFNVLNYFVTLNQAGNQCGPVGFEQACRGAETAFEFQRQREKLISALVKLDSDVVGLIELENTTGVEPLADIVTGLNEELGPDTYTYLETGTIGTDVIKVGFIYKPATVTTLGVHAVLDSSVDPRFDDDLNRPALAQTFIEDARGEVSTVVVNHLKSKSCTGATGGNADQGDGQACFNPARVAAAEAMVDWLAGYPTGFADDDFLVTGDLNSYAMEDPIAVFEAAGYVNLIAEFGGPEAYSFVFDGQWGYLDHALASPSLLGQVAGTAEYHINADEPSVLDYNTNFKSTGQIESLFAPDEFRTSDHDPVVVGLTLDGLDPDFVADPDVLWPPNHKYRSVELFATDLVAGELAVEIVEATSSEDDSGLGRDDLPNDIVITGADTLDLRAERFSTLGRTYTIWAFLSGGGQVVLDVTSVRVPHNQAARGGVQM